MKTPWRIAALALLLIVMESPVHAEVMDKTPGTGDFWFLAIVASLAGLILCRIHPAMGIFTLCAGALLPLGAFMDHDDMRRAVLAEAGPGYYTQASAALWTVCLSHAAGVVIWTVRRLRARARCPIDTFQLPAGPPAASGTSAANPGSQNQQA